MSSISIKLEKDESAVAALFNSLTITSATQKEIFESIGQGLADNTRLRFSDGVGPDGVAWDKSQRALRGGQTLVDTGRLQNSITYSLLPNGVEVGTNVGYAAPLHFGAAISAKDGGYLKILGAFGWFSKREVRIPARPILGLSTEDESYILEVISHFLSGD